MLPSLAAGSGIGAVERDTGLSKDTLRMWERRYGFPAPDRDHNGDRVYSPSQIARLQQIKRLLDAGHQPGRLITCSHDELQRLARNDSIEREDSGVQPSPHAEFMALLKTHDGDSMQRWLSQSLMCNGVQRFVGETVSELNIRVGEAWVRGELAIHEEHLYSHHIESTLRQAILLASHGGGAPRVLLTSMPGEQHRIGLAMAEALLAAAGAYCIALGPQTPASQIVSAAVAHRADIVALSFSAAFHSGAAHRSVNELRSSLPQPIPIWAGGEGLRRVRSGPGVQVFRDFARLNQAVSAWQAASSPGA